MRKALIVGIDHYDDDRIKNLKGAVKDAQKISRLLSANHGEEDCGLPNFSCNLLESSSEEKDKITRRKFQNEIKNLLDDDDTDIALLYFSGHGYESDLGGYLVTQDASEYEEGVSFNDIMIYANNSTVKEIVIILDSCRSGHLGTMAISKNHSVTLRKGISILTSSKANQDSYEKNGEGVFTKLICNALEGGNTDILGNVKLTHLYEHVDRMLGPWEQRPTFKSNSSRLTILRKSEPRIKYSVLKKITIYFKKPDYKVKLDPSFERSLEGENEANEKIMEHLRKMYALGLVRPINSEYMYDAADNSKHCELSEQGKQYWHLINKNLI